ncbi:MAG: ankyrin repeat domain-containing protein [Endozoicomonadaceae bacterium]|nr:ankyrin repeat domain-containing protein [Endozoicomonadaceae bacterium]
MNMNMNMNMDMDMDMDMDKAKYTLYQRVLIFIKRPIQEYFLSIFRDFYITSTDAELELILGVCADRQNQSKNRSPSKPIDNHTVYTSQENIVKTVVENVGNSQDVEAKFESDSIKAAKDGYVNLIASLVTNKHYRPNALDDNNRTPLECAIARGSLEVVQYLFSMRSYISKYHGTSDCYYKNETLGTTSLHIAAKYGRLYIMRYLIDNLPNYDKKNMPHLWLDKHNKTPFLLAIEHEHLEVVKYLTEVFKSESEEILDYWKGVSLIVILRYGYLYISESVTLDVSK